MTIMPQLDVRAIGIQWDLLAISYNAKTKYIIEDIAEESLPSEADETDVNTSFHFSQEATTTE